MLKKLEKILQSCVISIHEGLGDKYIGYDFGQFDRSSSVENKTAILVFTSENHFLKKLIGWKNRGYIENCKIFLDEIHERSFANDILLGTLKNLYQS